MFRYIVLALCVGLVSCEKEPELFFQVPVRGLEFTIPAGANPFEAQYFNFDSIPIANLVYGASGSVDPAAVPSIRPLRAGVEAFFGNVDYDFIQEISVTLCPVGVKTPNCGREIFWRSPVPFNNGPILDLIPNENDVKDEVLEDYVNIQFKIVRLRESPNTFVESILSIDFAGR